MKHFAYWLYGMIFNFFRLFPVNNKKAVFFMVHDSHFQGNLRCVHDSLSARRNDFRCIVVSKKRLFSFWFTQNYHLATAAYWFLNDNFLPLAHMHVSPQTKVIQLWHGVGALKRFGLTTETDPLVRSCVLRGNSHLTHLFVSSRQIIPFYAEAFGVPEGRIYPTGLPVTDFYFDEQKKEAARQLVFQTYPQLAGKKILLYTPTFRRTDNENSALLEHFDYRQLSKELGTDWAILIRLHPRFPQKLSLQDIPCYNVSAYEDIKGLYVAADILINDYSSTMVEFALLQKPIILYAYDLGQYDRGFYRDYMENAPGPVVSCMEELAGCIKTGCYDPIQNSQFLSLHYDYFDSGSTRRVIDTLLQ